MNFAWIVRNKLKREVNTFHRVPEGEEQRTKGRENYYERHVKIDKATKDTFHLEYYRRLSGNHEKQTVIYTKNTRRDLRMKHPTDTAN